MASREEIYQANFNRWHHIGPRIAGLAMVGVSLFAVNKGIHEVSATSSREPVPANIQTTPKKEAPSQPTPPDDLGNIMILGGELLALGASASILASDTMQDIAYNSYAG